MSKTESQKSTPAAVINAVRRKPRQLPHPRSVRLPDDVDAAVSSYMEQNRINFNQLCAFALEKYMAEPQSIRFQPVSVHKEDKTEATAIGRRSHDQKDLAL